MRSDLGSLRSPSEDAPLGERAATTLDLRSLAQGGSVRLPCWTAGTMVLTLGDRLTTSGAAP